MSRPRKSVVESGEEMLVVPVLEVLDVPLILAEVWRRRHSRPRVAFDAAGFSFRALQRVGLAPERVLRPLVRAAGARDLFRLGHDGDHADYPEIQSWALETSTDVTLRLDPVISASPAFKRMAAFLGDSATRSYFRKVVARNAVFPALLAGRLARAEHTGHLFLWWGITTPQEAPREVARVIEDVWVAGNRSGMRSVLERVATTVFAAGAVATTLSAVLRRGIDGRPRPRRKYKVALEFIDENHISGGSRDADGVLDGDALNREDAVMFLTGTQRRFLRQLHGREAVAVAVAAAEESGLPLVDLASVRYRWSTLREVVRASLGSTTAAWRKGDAWAAAALWPLHWDLLDFSSLFEEVDPAVILYCPFPNGHSGFRWNSGAVTGLARRHGTVSVGMQTRSVYLRKWEDSLDCFDHLLFWGEAYRRFLGDRGMDLVSASSLIGSINLGAGVEDPVRGAATRKQVLAFPGDYHPPNVDGKHHYTFRYNRDFLRALVTFAARNPDVDVLVKPKDLEHADRYELDGVFSGVELPANFECLRRLRDDYWDQMVSADVVAAMGFTSPGTDALLIGKPTVFFTRLGPGRGVFVAAGGPVVDQETAFVEELESMVRSPGRLESQALDGLDPFRDGCAMSRAAQIIDQLARPAAASKAP